MKLLPYLFITVIIFVFNIISIWGFDGLYIDDQSYYYLLYDKTLSTLPFHRNIFHSIFQLGIFKIAGYFSIYFARFLIILLLSIPSASLIYYFSYSHFHITRNASIGIAVLPFILPNEIMVPTYLSGSYLIMAILFALISIYFILKYLNRSKFSITYFILAAGFYYITTESSELFAMMLPLFLFLIFIFRKLSWKQFLLAAILSCIAIRKTFLVLSNPHGKVNNISNDFPIAVIKDRIIHFVSFINPLDGLNMGILNIILILIILLGAILVFLNHERINNYLQPNRIADEPKNKYFYFTYYYLFPAGWLIISILPFIFFSYFFESRYFIVASIASCFLFITSIGVIASLFTRHKMVFESAIILVIVISGFSRQIEFKNYYQPRNVQYNSLEQALKSYNLPENVQIVVAAPSYVELKIGNGTTNYATGTLQYVLKRRDVKGQITKENCFYDPFQIYKNAYTNRNANIDTTKNTILLRCLNTDLNQNRRLYYALRWIDDKSKDSPWSIFTFDELGKATNLISASGYVRYVSMVDSLSSFGITRNDILFGGDPTRKDSLRLGL